MDDGRWLLRARRRRPGVNVLSLVPAAALDRRARPFPASGDETRRMQELLAESLAEGAWELPRPGLEYAQEAGATEAEVAELCRTLARAGSLYATHTRRRDEGAADSSPRR